MQTFTYRLELAYDGAAFYGYARQPGLHTVEGAIRAALLKIAPDLRALAVAGRTDRGVSAAAQVVSFRSAERLRLPELEEALLTQLGPAQADTLSALELRRVPRRFHARWSAKARRYRYLAPPVPAAQAARVDAMLLPLIGSHDFHAFCRDTPAGRPSTRRLISARARLGHEGEAPRLVFELCAEGFLRRQLRVLVATAIFEAAAGAPAGRLLELVEGRDRRQTQWPAPPEPLCLSQIHYDPL